ncbi:hypothetical protein B0H11DRAFT_2241335 [Mycena galericulata]|nr:hypothetical protein B0H11DRAFT_2241335 [Mycena galericulata]
MAVCQVPFYPSHSNYKSDDEHDANHRKIWFLVLDGAGGLFTIKHEALAFVEGDEDKVDLFFKRKQALARWATHCRMSHDQTDAAHQGERPEPATSTLRHTTPAATPRHPPGPAHASPVRAKTPAPLRDEEVPRKHKSTPVPLFMDDDEPDLRDEEAPRKRKSTPVPLFMDNDEPDPWTVRRATPGPAPACAPGPAHASPVRAKAPAPLRVDEGRRKDGEGDGAPTPDGASAALNKRPKAGQVSHAPGVPKKLAASVRARTTSVSTSASTSVSIARAGIVSTSVSTPASVPTYASASTARARTVAPAFPPRTPVPPSTPGSSSTSAARARTAAPAFPPRTPMRGSTCGSGSGSPRRALSAVPPLGAHAEPPPVYTVESGSDSESSSPAPVVHTVHGAGVSPSVSSVSSLSSPGASERPNSPSPSPSPSRAGLASPRAGVASASSASRAGFASSASRAGTRPASASSSAEAQPLLLYNTGSRTFYKNPSMAVREMTEEESVEVVDCEDVGEFLSARAGRRAGESARGV